MPEMPKTFRSRSRQAINRDYDQRRGSARDRGYTTRWDREAKAFRAAHPLCIGCLAVGRTSATEVVDHIIPHDGDERLMWDPMNRQPSCTPHHSIVKQKLEALFKVGAIDAADLSLASDRAKQLTIELLR
ncbi:MAG: HNH endonuclease signature motif containing protein [Alphaproteobacteria bacterium]|nr:HNH endonuclease signature motif containing protein [Alphaproteobacteria bacterium]